MTHVNKKMILGLAVSFAFLFGTLAAPVSALQINLVINQYNQAYASGANNHTYMYVEPDPLDFVSRSSMHVNENLDYTTYWFDGTGWNSPDSSRAEGTNAPFYWTYFNGWATGPFDNPTLLPAFFDFEASDGSDHVINTTLETRTFGLTFGQETPVLADVGYSYFGTLGISGQEFVHLTIDSRQDDVSWAVGVIDPEGRFITVIGGSGGDILTIPFKPTIAGTYYIILEANPSAGTFALFNLLPVAVAPQAIAAGNIVTGELPTGEIVSRTDTGSWVHQEMAPTVHTYKVESPNDVASLTYAFNYPSGILPITQMHGIFFTSSEFEYGYDGGFRYEDGIGFPGNGEYFFRGGPYYVTVIGGDGTEYTLYHQANSRGALPLNEESQFENYIGAAVTHAYTLDIANASLLRMNSTASGGELSVRIVGAFEDGYRTDQAISFGANLLNSDEYYLPPGEYLVEMEVSNNVNEWVEFNLGQIVDVTTTEIVDVGGFFVDTDIFQMYNMTIFLNNEDNVTVGLDVTIYDASGREMYSAGMLIANRWDGSQIQPHPTYWANATFNYAGHDWSDSAFVGVCAYLVNNNTEIPATNGYIDYPLDLTVQWTNRLNDYFVNIESLDVSTSAASYNFSLPLPGSSNEFHGLVLNTTPGTWYNVSVMSADIGGRFVTLYSGYDGRTHTTGWTDLNDAYVGVTQDYSIQFGAISDNLLLEFQLTRNQAVDGFLYVLITPMETNPLVFEEIAPLGPDILAVLGGVAVPAVIGVGVIVIVYIVYVKKFKK